MAKSKTTRPDQHVSTLLVRLPEWCRPALDALRAKNRRPFTVEMLIALERHCLAEGVSIPSNPEARK